VAALGRLAEQGPQRRGSRARLLRLASRWHEFRPDHRSRLSSIRSLLARSLAESRSWVRPSPVAPHVLRWRDGASRAHGHEPRAAPLARHGRLDLHRARHAKTLRLGSAATGRAGPASSSSLSGCGRGAATRLWPGSPRREVGRSSVLGLATTAAASAVGSVMVTALRTAIWRDEIKGRDGRLRVLLLANAVAIADSGPGHVSLTGCFGWERRGCPLGSSRAWRGARWLCPRDRAGRQHAEASASAQRSRGRDNSRNVLANHRTRAPHRFCA